MCEPFALATFALARYTESMIDDRGRPTVLLDYSGVDDDPAVEDIFVYVRPETNGVEIESRLLRVIKHCPAYRNGLDLVYMANLPGEYILDRHIVERHYAHKLFFAVHGAPSFTPEMRDEFERRSRSPFRSDCVLGGYQALKILGMTPEELFGIWVDDDSMITVAGQTLKRIENYWVIGYDIPALLHKNTRNTDIAVMLFRSRVGYPYFVELVERMYEQIIDDGLVDRRIPRSRLFHYSRSPFEQVLDGSGYLIRSDGSPAGLDDLTFARYLDRHGVPDRSIRGILRHPMFLWRPPNGERYEHDIYGETEHFSYPDALARLEEAVGQRLLVPWSPTAWESAA